MMKITLPLSTSGEAVDVVRRYAARLSARLGIKHQPLVNLSASEEVCVAGHLVVHRAGAKDPAAALCETVFRHREQLFAENFEGTSWGKFGVEAVRRGLSVDRLSAFVTRSGSFDADAFEAFADSAGPREAWLRMSAVRRNTLDNSSDIPEDQRIDALIASMKDALFYELGARFPVRVVVDDSLGDDEVCVDYGELPGWREPGLALDEHLVNGTVEHLRVIGVEGRRTVNPSNGLECAVVRGAEVERVCAQAGFTTWSCARHMILRLSRELRAHAGSSLTLRSVEATLDLLAGEFPELVGATLRRTSMPRLTRILRALLDEEISIRNLRSILDAILMVRGTTAADFDKHIVFAANTGYQFPTRSARPAAELAPEEVAECVRMGLARQISHQHTRGGNTLVVILMTPTVESTIGANPLTNTQRQKLVDALRNEIVFYPDSTHPVILTTATIRRHLRRLLEPDFPNLAVLSYNELSPDLNIQPLARIDASL